MWDKTRVGSHKSILINCRDSLKIVVDRENDNFLHLLDQQAECTKVCIFGNLILQLVITILVTWGEG